MIQNFITKMKYNLSTDEVAVDLRKYSHSTQSLIKSRYDLVKKSWMDEDSKVFFRLWRFVYRDLQRSDGFGDDIKEYDEFIQKWKLFRIEGDYAIVKRRLNPRSMKGGKMMADAIKEANKLRQDSIDSIKEQYNTAMISGSAVELDDTTVSSSKSPTPYRLRLHNIEAADRHRTVERFVKRLMYGNLDDVLDKYRGVTINDIEIMQGLYNALLVFSDRLSRTDFGNAWQLLGIVNGTQVSVEDYWRTDFTQIVSHGYDEQHHIYKFRGHTINREFLDFTITQTGMNSMLDTDTISAKTKSWNRKDVISEWLLRKYYVYPKLYNGSIEEIMNLNYQLTSIAGKSERTGT